MIRYRGTKKENAKVIGKYEAHKGSFNALLKKANNKPVISAKALVIISSVAAPIANSN